MKNAKKVKFEPNKGMAGKASNRHGKGGGKAGAKGGGYGGARSGGMK